MTPTTYLPNCLTWSHVSCVLNHPIPRDLAAGNHIYRLNKSTGVIQADSLNLFTCPCSPFPWRAQERLWLTFSLWFCLLPPDEKLFCCASAWPVVAPPWDLILPSSWLQLLYPPPGSLRMLRTMGHENHPVSPSSHLCYFWGTLLFKSSRETPTYFLRALLPWRSSSSSR